MYVLCQRWFDYTSKTSILKFCEHFFFTSQICTIQSLSKLSHMSEFLHSSHASWSSMLGQSSGEGRKGEGFCSGRRCVLTCASGSAVFRAPWFVAHCTLNSDPRCRAAVHDVVTNSSHITVGLSEIRVFGSFGSGGKESAVSCMCCRPW